MATDLKPTTEETIAEYNQQRFKNYDINKYNWKLHQYPEGLGTKPDLRHYVAFYVNVREKAMSRNPDAYNTFNKGDVAVLRTTQKLTPEQISGNIGEIVGIQTGLLSLGITSVNSIFKNVGGSSSSPIAPNARAGGASTTTKIINGVGGLFKGIAIAAGAGAAARYVAQKAVDNIPILKTSTFLRLKDVITLHIEDRPTVKYGMNYAEADLGLLAGLIASGAASIETLTNLENYSLDALSKSEGVAAVLATLAKLPAAVGGGRAQDLLGASAGVNINPFREALFESIDYRTFNFKYRFFPKSENETKNIQNIINTFKFHMHPDLSSSNLFFIYPSEFEIVYYYVDPETGKNKENPYLHRIGNCALTDMAVEYGGDTFSTFDNGAPTQINLTLTFRELEQLTKREMRQGF